METFHYHTLLTWLNWGLLKNVKYVGDVSYRHSKCDLFFSDTCVYFSVGPYLRLRQGQFLEPLLALVDSVHQLDFPVCIMMAQIPFSLYIYLVG